MISKRGSKSTVVAASFLRMLASPCTLAVPSVIWASSGFAPIIVFSRSDRNCSPLSGVIRLIVKALRLSMRMPRKLRNNSVDIVRITSGLAELGISPCGIPDRSS